MNKKIIFELKSLYRDNMRITGFEFGNGEKSESVCIVGAMRGNEIQQVYICSQLVRRLKELESGGYIASGKSIMVIPSVNPSSMNIGKRFWPTDNTDINRMFPGYDKGETTQRIAAGVFSNISGYKYGIQFASFYMPGRFVPHVKMMKTGYESVELAKMFGLPYVVLRQPRPYDTTTLNYNWQLWECNAFSLYTNCTERIDDNSCEIAIQGILNFLSKSGIITEKPNHEGYISSVISDNEMVSVKSHYAGIFRRVAEPDTAVHKGDLMAKIIDPYERDVIDEIIAPMNGRVFFVQDNPLVYSGTPLFKII